jgi:tRNA(Arg) A34 adenosine deaminase TadA
LIYFSVIFRNRWTNLLKYRTSSVPLDGLNNPTEIQMHFMRIALEYARKAAELLGEMPIGAIIVQKNENGKLCTLVSGSQLGPENLDASIVPCQTSVAMHQAARTINNGDF